MYITLSFFFFFNINPWTSEKANFPFYFLLWINLVLLNNLKCGFHWNKTIFDAKRISGLFNLSLSFWNIYNGKIPLRNTEGFHVNSTGLLRQCRYTISFSLAGSVGTGLGEGLVRSNWRCPYCTSTQQLIQECYCPGSPGLLFSPAPRGARPAWKPEDLFQDSSLSLWWNPRQLLSSWATWQTYSFNKPCQAQWIFFFFTNTTFWLLTV